MIKVYIKRNFLLIWEAVCHTVGEVQGMRVRTLVWGSASGEFRVGCLLVVSFRNWTVLPAFLVCESGGNERREMFTKSESSFFSSLVLVRLPFWLSGLSSHTDFVMAALAEVLYLYDTNVLVLVGMFEIRAKIVHSGLFEQGAKVH